MDTVEAEHIKAHEIEEDFEFHENFFLKTVLFKILLNCLLKEAS